MPDKPKLLTAALASLASNGATRSDCDTPSQPLALVTNSTTIDFDVLGSNSMGSSSGSSSLGLPYSPWESGPYSGQCCPKAQEATQLALALSEPNPAIDKGN